MGICEDFLDPARFDKPDDLFVVSYDIRKAFDSVQRFSIIAACRRLGMPDSFAKYVVATLDGASSSVRCRHGLSESFPAYARPELG